MQGRKSTVFKSAIAISLMALLLFIHAAKLLHTHHNNAFLSSATDNTGKTYIAGASSICSICSFEYVRDAVVPDGTFTVAPPAVALPSITGECLFTIPTTDILAIAARGPPAMA